MASKLTDFPQPSVAVDVALLTVRDGALFLVVVEHRTGGLALPGTFMHEGELLAESAARALRTKVGLEDVEFAQLQVFDTVDRDNRGRVLSVAHSGAIASRRVHDRVVLIPVIEGQSARPLRFDHELMVELAVNKLREQYGRTIDPAGLLGETFTVLELRKVYEAVFGRELLKDTFRRHVIEALEATGETGAAFGRPAELFRRRLGAVLGAKAPAFFSTDRQQEPLR